MRAGMIGICCCLLVVMSFAADPAVRASLTKAQIDQKLAELSLRQVDLSFMVKDQIQRNDTLWMDPKYTSPKIEELRKRMEALKREMMQLQLALRESVMELPDARAEIEKVAQGRTESQSIARQMEELKKQREQAP